MASPAIDPIDLLPDLVNFRSNLLHELFGYRLPPNRHLSVTLIMTLDAIFLDGIEGHLFLGGYPLMAIDAFDHI